jgi:D-amino-acid oxidase
MASVTVIGAGVIGLSTALALQQRGHRVHVIAAASSGSTSGLTSLAAGAVWYPFKVGPVDRVGGRDGWAARTRRWLTELAHSDPSAGVDLLIREELSDSPAIPWWGDASDDLRLQRADTNGPVPVYTWRFTAPRCEPAIFLTWLEALLHQPVERQHVRSFADVPGEIVVNCTGLGSRALANDASVEAVFGQTVIAASDGFDLSLCAGDERFADAVFYVIPRRNEVVLGGCAIPHDAETPAVPTDEISADILARARAKGFHAVRVVRSSAGLRPCRPEVRLERDLHDPRVIHNYGHGGGGYTLAWGCALDVAGLVDASAAGRIGNSTGVPAKF